MSAVIATPEYFSPPHSDSFQSLGFTKFREQLDAFNNWAHNRDSSGLSNITIGDLSHVPGISRGMKGLSAKSFDPEAKEKVISKLMELGIRDACPNVYIQRLGQTDELGNLTHQGLDEILPSLHERFPILKELKAYFQPYPGSIRLPEHENTLRYASDGSLVTTRQKNQYFSTPRRGCSRDDNAYWDTSSLRNGTYGYARYYSGSGHDRDMTAVFIVSNDWNELSNFLTQRVQKTEYDSYTIQGF